MLERCGVKDYDSLTNALRLAHQYELQNEDNFRVVLLSISGLFYSCVFYRMLRRCT